MSMETAGLQSVPAADKTEVEAIIFLHIPKSVGTTLNRLIEWEYPLFQMYSVDPFFFKWSRDRLWRLPRQRLQKFRVFKGHMRFGLHKILPQPATYLTVMRAPIDRVISVFYFMRNYKLHPNYLKFRREKWTVEDFIKEPHTRDNIQCKMIAGVPYEQACTAEALVLAKSHLVQHFSVVGLTKRFEESLALMKLRFGWELKSYSSFNITRARPKRRELPQATLERIAERNRFDVELYEFAVKMFEEAIAKKAAEVDRIRRELEAAWARVQVR